MRGLCKTDDLLCHVCKLPTFEAFTNSIFLLALGQSNDLKTTESKTELLQDFLSTINELAAEGIVFTVQGIETQLYGHVLAFLGGSLACHNMARFKESFAPNVRYACRLCSARTCDFPKFFRHKECPLRTDDEISRQVAQLMNTNNGTERIELSASCGINGPSVLNLLTGFSLTLDLLFDPMHVLLEGIPKEISMFLHYHIQRRRSFSRRQLNDALANFKFDKAISSSDYPRQFDASLTLVSSASATAILMLHLPLLIEKIVATNTLGPTFECYITMCKIAQLMLIASSECCSS